MTITKNVWKAAALLLILCLVSTVMISGTYAQYTSTYAGQDTALVAKWNVIGSGDGGVTFSNGGAIHLDLFSHAYKDNIIASESGIYIIAPGVKDQFVLSFNNNSDVAAKITFDIATTGTASNVPIEYSFDDFETAPLTLEQLETQLGNTFANIPADPDASDSAVTKTVFWRWDFNGNSATDTALGTASAAGENRTTYGLTINATAEQLSPATGIK